MESNASATNIVSKAIITTGTFVAGFTSASTLAFSPGEALAISLTASAAFFALDELWNKRREIVDILHKRGEAATIFNFTGFNKPKFPKQAQPTNEPIAMKIQRLDRKVAASLQENNVQFSSRRVVVAPRHLTVQFRLLNNDTATLNRAERSQGTIQLNTGINRIRVYTDGAYFCVEMPNPEPRNVYTPELKGSGVRVPLGITSKNQQLSIDFSDSTTPHLGLPGPTGAGKSQTARSIAYSLIRQNSHNDVRIVVIGQKYEDWKPFEIFPHFAAFVGEPAEIIAAMEWLKLLTHTRSTSDQIVSKPRIFVFMDDTPALLEMTDKLILSAMNYISSQGRAPGVHLIFGAQDWTNAGIGSGIVKANVKARMIFGAASTTKAAASAGRGKSGAHLIEGKGDALYINSNVEIPVAASMVTNRMLLELVQQKYGNPSPRPWRPWLTEEEEKPKAKATKQAARQEVEEEYVGADDDAEKLPNRPPNRIGNAYLRELYQELGSKNAVLKAAWGGVVNDSGKTPKTLEWLNNALGESQ